MNSPAPNLPFFSVPALFAFPVALLLFSCQESRPAFFNMQPPVSEPGTGLKASDCGACHQNQYRDWQHSTHAAAYTDLQFQSEISKPGAPKELCKNCHIPLGNQRESLTDGKANPTFDAALQQEGVTCAACHVRTENGHSVIVGSQTSTAATAVKSGTHAVVVDRAYLLGRCESCHQANARFTEHYVCSFNTAQELRSGPFGKTHTCASCHLETGTITENAIKAEPDRITATDPDKFTRHVFPGGGVPKRFDLFPYLLTVRHDTALDFELGEIVFSQSDRSGQIQIPVQIRNARAGHSVPTADPERFVLVRVRLLDERNGELMRQEYRIGQVWQWEPAKKLSDNRLAPLESRRHVFLFESTQSVRFIELTAYHVRLTKENGRYIQATAGMADPAFRKDIAALDRLYPFAALLWSRRLDLVNGTSIEKNRVERNSESSGIRGYPE